MEIPIRLNLPDQKPTTPLDQILQDVTVTEIGVLPRPGYEQLHDLETSAKIDGIYDWREANCVIVVSGGGVYKVNSSIDTTNSALLLESGSYLLLEDGFRLLLDLPPTVEDVSGATGLVTGTRVSFSNYGDYLFMANGAQIQMLAAETSYVSHGGNDWQCILNHTAAAASEPGVGGSTATYWTDLGAGSSYDAWATGTRYSSGLSDVLEDADAPITVSHVAVADTYLLALESGTQRIWFSAVTEPYTWDSEWFSAQYLPDDANCMLTKDGDIWVCGTRSIESFVNDGVTPWVPSGYGAISHGVLAPYSFAYIPELTTFVWVDDNRRFVRLDGRTPVSINHSLDTFIRKVPSVSDAITDYAIIGGTPYIFLQFPSSKQAVAINLLNSTYSEFTADGQTIWDVACITNVPSWDLIIAGHRTDGTLLSMSVDTATDNTGTIPAKIRSPRIHSDNVTTVPRLIMHFTKLVSSDEAGDASIGIKYRSDGGDWSTERTITLTDNEKTDFVVNLWRLDHYKYYRQYEFNLSSLHPYSLVKVEQV